MARAYSPTEILAKKYKRLEWGERWVEAFGKPESRGVWVANGNSGNGKSSGLMQITKELAPLGKVFYNALEEGTSLTMQENLIRSDIASVKRNVLIGKESMEEMTNRMLKRKSPQFYIVDSLQYTKMNWKQYLYFKEAAIGAGKLVIFTSHAEGTKPRGKIARDVWYDADLKLWIEGYKMISNGRYNPGGEFTIWEEGARKYWGAKAASAKDK